jgi:predicted RNA-binding Zn-ribbon protein involved in translation (DUF1610 family)
LMAIELKKLLTADFEHLLAGRSVMLDLLHHTQDVTAFRRNPRCRFDHETWRIEPLAGTYVNPAVREAINLAGNDGESAAGWRIGLEGHAFTRMQFCPQCGYHSIIPLQISRRIPAKQRECEHCGAAMVVRGIDMLESINEAALTKSDWRRPLSSLGFQPGDVFSLGSPSGDRHFELAARRSRGKSRRRGRQARALVGQESGGGRDA